MLEIIKGTPIWVWVLLIYIVNKGIGSLKDRTVSIKKIIILPIVMTYISIKGQTHYYIYFILFFISIILGFKLFFSSVLSIDKVKKTLTLKGDVISFLLIISTFIYKYVTNVLLAINPAINSNHDFFVVNSTISGILGGLIFSRTLVYLYHYKKDII